jgi:HEPN domain-containing protein
MKNINFEIFTVNYRSAQMYHYRAEQFLAEGQYHSVVFNVASVALENYLIALCDLYGVEPVNHNYTCLMNTVEEFMDFPELLSREIRALDSIFGICYLESYHHGTPKPSDSARILALCGEIRALFDPARLAEAKAA